MGVQVESRGQLQEFLDVLKRRKWQVTLPAAVLITIGTAFAVLVPKKFLMKTQVELRPVSISISSKEGNNAQFQIPSSSRIRKVLQDLKNTPRGAEYLALKPEEQTEFIEDIQDDIKVALAKDTSKETGASFVNIAYSDVEQEFGVRFLRALRQDWIQDVLERDRNKVQDEEKKIQEEGQSLDKQLAKEEEQLTALKSENGISATQPIPGGEGIRGEDPVYARLQRNKETLADIELDLVKLDVEILELEKQHLDMPEKLSVDEVVGGTDNAAELQALELEYLDVQTTLKRYRPGHSKYKMALQRARDLEERREQLTRLITKAEILPTTTPNPERTTLRAAIDRKKLERTGLHATQQKLAKDIERDDRDSRKLQTVYSEIRERSARIQRLREARLGAAIAYQQKVREGKILSSPLASPFEITQDVYAPPTATEPNLWLIVAFSVIAGLAVGLGVAVLSEYSKNCFRSVNDISRVMVVPVLGSINTIVTRREARLSTARRAAIGIATAAGIGVIVFVTWAWEKDPDRLSPDMRAKIQDFREIFI